MSVILKEQAITVWVGTLPRRSYKLRVRTQDNKYEPYSLAGVSEIVFTVAPSDTEPPSITRRLTLGHITVVHDGVADPTLGYSQIDVTFPVIVGDARRERFAIYVSRTVGGVSTEDLAGTGPFIVERAPRPA